MTIEIRSSFCKLIFLTLLFIHGSIHGQTQSYPSKQIKIVVPFATGGIADMAGRRMSQSLSEILMVPVIVENKGGAGGMIGAEAVAKSPPDGYTLLLGSNGPLSVGPALYPNVPYQPLRDFAPIISLGVSPIVLVVNPSVPAKNMKELLVYLRANPGTVSIASPGVGTSSHLAGELFQQLTGTKLVHIPYKGSGPAMTDLLGGQVQMAFDPLSSSLPFIKQGKLRAIAVTTDTRSPSAPDIPTLDEVGVKGYEASTYVALLAPAGTPPEVIEKLNIASRKALATPAMTESFAQYATVPTGGSPEQLSAYIKRDLDRWTKVIKEANIKPE
jgi:tripartite-type tricarboxylate transporter receptor subunit TctC